ncbi:MAG: isocitrate lyase/PEP mutase family protein [Chloroflexota bacterium]
MTQQTPAQALRTLIQQPDIITLPCCFDAFSAKLIERAGFKSTFISGFASIAARYGLPDMGLISFGEAVDIARPILNSLQIPVFVDADTGYGSAINIQRTVRTYARAGAAAVMIEDQVWPKRCGHVQGKQVVGRQEAINRIRAASDARDRQHDILILARTDARGTDSLAEALYRAQAFADAGADMVFVEAPASIQELEEVVRQSPVPTFANMVEDGVTPWMGPQALQEIGFKFAAYPLMLLGSCAANMQDTLVRLQAGEQAERRLTFGEIREVLDFAGFDRVEEQYR